ncbi:MAG TPA: glycosyltransferase family 39 protein [Streptosporangiaceae bacterium]|nr:glycosyltransferase family 39 protein [Streptosporangiaceae bacterium]
MSKRPPSTPPPPRPGPARRGAAYKRPVQSPDAETVMLPSFTKDAEPGNGRDPGAPAPPGEPGRDTPDHGRDTPGATTRVLVLPRGRHSSAPVRFAQASARRTWVSRAVLAAILCVQAALSLRMHNTAFEDEALYLYSGHLEIAHWLHGAALQGDYATFFSGAPVLYPVLGALADSVGGLAAARAVSLIAMLTTTGLLYSLTRRLFNERVGLCAAVIFSVTESALFLGNLATYDAPALCLLAAASWIVVRTAASRWPLYLLAAPVAALSVASKYAALLFVPTIAALAGLAAWPHRGRKALIPPFAFAAALAALLAAALHLAGASYLQGVKFTTLERFEGNTPTSVLLKDSLQWGAIAFGLAVIGSVAYAIRPRTEPGEQIAPPGSRLRRIALGVVLTGTALLAPADQIHLHTFTSLQKHIGFGLFFASPLAGVGLARIVGDHFRRAQVGIAIWGAALVLGMVQANNLFNAWPNSASFTKVMAKYLQPRARYLVEVDEVPIYYLRHHSDAQPDQFTSTYYIGYVDSQGQFLTGNAGYVAAIRAGYFQVVSYNFQTTPAVDGVLAHTLETDPSYRLAAALPNGNDTVTQYVWVKTPDPSVAPVTKPGPAPVSGRRSRPRRRR